MVAQSPCNIGEAYDTGILKWDLQGTSLMLYHSYLSWTTCMLHLEVPQILRQKNLVMRCRTYQSISQSIKYPTEPEFVKKTSQQNFVARDSREDLVKHSKQSVYYTAQNSYIYQSFLLLPYIIIHISSLDQYHTSRFTMLLSLNIDRWWFKYTAFVLILSRVSRPMPHAPAYFYSNPRRYLGIDDDERPHAWH